LVGWSQKTSEMHQQRGIKKISYSSFSSTYSSFQRQPFSKKNIAHRIGSCQLQRNANGRGPLRANSISLPISAESSAKESLLAAVVTTERGIFGMKKAERVELAELVEAVEAVNPLPNPTEHLEQVVGNWRLIYTTVQILGSRRTKLGLRNLIKLGDFIQTIDLEKSQAVNKVAFIVPGNVYGALTIEASFEIVSPSRVSIAYQNSSLVPNQLQALFQKNFDLLLSIFNPEGWLELTYVDEDMRIGRDDKGNIFVLEKILE